MTEFSLSDGAFSSLAAEGAALRCKKESCICGMSGPLGLMCERFLVSCLPRGFYLGLIAPATVGDTCNESVNPFVTRP